MPKVLSPPTRQQTRPHPGPMAAPFLEFDLGAEIDRLHREAAWQTGRNAKTLVKYADLRVVLMALQSRARTPGHVTDGRISIQTISGHLAVRAEGRTFDLPAGRLLTLDRATPHEIEALEESACLLTIVWPEGEP